MKLEQAFKKYWWVLLLLLLLLRGCNTTPCGSSTISTQAIQPNTQPQDKYYCCKVANINGCYITSCPSGSTVVYTDFFNTNSQCTSQCTNAPLNLSVYNPNSDATCDQKGIYYGCNDPMTEGACVNAATDYLSGIGYQGISKHCCVHSSWGGWDCFMSATGIPCNHITTPSSQSSCTNGLVDDGDTCVFVAAHFGIPAGCMESGPV